MIKRSALRVRDPYILLHENTYYLYATTDEKTLSYYTSHDLNNWEEGGAAFTITDDSWACRDVWAGEVHRYNGKFYLFVSLRGKSELYPPEDPEKEKPTVCPGWMRERCLRGTQIAVSDTPVGPFLPLVNRPVTPLDQSCIDGTLFVQDGIPYIFYSHDWPDCYRANKDAYVGQICAARLSEDLKEIVGEPWVLFDSDQSPISAKTPHHIDQPENVFTRYGSDAPFVQRLSDGKLLLTWSPYLQNNYVVLGVISESGNVRGPWKHLETPIFENNGGHAMFFSDRRNNWCMTLHAPERESQERAHIFVMREENGTLAIDREIVDAIG